MQQLAQPLDLPGGKVVIEVWVRTQRPIGGVVMNFRVNNGVTFGAPVRGPVAGDLSLFSETEGEQLCAVLTSFEGHKAEPNEGILLKIPIVVKYPHSKLSLTNIGFSTDDGQLTTIDQFHLEVKRIDQKWREEEREIDRDISSEGRENR
jgi:hypothetical protein